LEHYEKRNLEIHSADYREYSHGDSNDSRSDELYVEAHPVPPKGKSDANNIGVCVNSSPLTPSRKSDVDNIGVCVRSSYHYARWWGNI